MQGIWALDPCDEGGYASSLFVQITDLERDAVRIVRPR
jgi:hypothetical protein